MSGLWVRGGSFWENDGELMIGIWGVGWYEMGDRLVGGWFGQYPFTIQIREQCMQSPIYLYFYQMRSYLINLIIILFTTC